MMEVGGETWRTYYQTTDHPLHAATSGSLSVPDDGPQSLVTEYYKLSPLGHDGQLALHKDAKLTDVWT